MDENQTAQSAPTQTTGLTEPPAQPLPPQQPIPTPPPPMVQAMPQASIPSIPTSEKRRSPLILFFIIAFILIIAVGVPGAYFYLKSTAIPTDTDLTENATPKPTVKPAAAEGVITLTLDSPVADSLTTGSRTTVTGKTNPQALIMIYGSGGEVSVEADSGGSFSTDLTLVPGVNTVTVTAFDRSGGEKTLTVDIVRDSGV